MKTCFLLSESITQNEIAGSAATFCFPTSNGWSLQFFCQVWALCVVICYYTKNSSHSDKCLESHCSCMSLIANGIEHVFFMCLVAICSLVKCLLSGEMSWLPSCSLVKCLFKFMPIFYCLSFLLFSYYWVFRVLLYSGFMFCIEQLFSKYFV